ncbi:hypothetical protein ABYF34_02140 [Buchananella felis]|uniref:hypothetical protein n=1 Tax=Buchananella felis TaxID=3231492 RepID=UPI003529098D
MATGIKTRKRNRILAAVLLPVALLLSSCSIKMDIGLNVDKTVDIVYEVDLHEMYGIDGSNDPEAFCASMFEESSQSLPEGSFTMENVGTDTAPVCKLTAQNVPVDTADGMGIVFEGDTVTVTIDGSTFNDPEMDQVEGFLNQLDFSFTMTFPGKVSESTIGSIDGNKVTISKFEDFQQGGTIVASMIPSKSDYLLWFLLVGGVLLVGGGVAAFFIMNNKKKAAAAALAQPYPVPNSYGPGQAGPQGSQPQAAHHFPPQQAYPVQQPYPAQPQQPVAPQQGYPAQQPYPAQPQQPMPPQQPYPPQG